MKSSIFSAVVRTGPADDAAAPLLALVLFAAGAEVESDVSAAFLVELGALTPLEIDDEEARWVERFRLPVRGRDSLPDESEALEDMMVGPVLL
jgi:hypothetical protein